MTKVDNNNFQEIEEFFGMLEGKLGTMADIDNRIEEGRKTRKGRFMLNNLISSDEEYYDTLEVTATQKSNYQKIDRSKNIGIKEDLSGKRVYLDSGIFVYLLNGFEESEVLNDLKDMMLKNEIEVYLLEWYGAFEVCASCVRNNEDEENMEITLAKIEKFLDNFTTPKYNSKPYMGDVSSFPNSYCIESLATLYLGAAAHNECHVFLTNDSNIIGAPDGMELIHFSDYKDVP